MKNVPLKEDTVKFAKNHYNTLMETIDRFAPELKKEGLDAANVTGHILASVVLYVNERSEKEGGGKIPYDAVCKTIVLGMCITYLEAKHGFKK